MGMFDTVVLEEGLELPDGFNHHGVEFQTKSLHSTLSRYRITKDGKIELWINDGYRETGEYRDTYFLGRQPITEPINPRWSAQTYHGDVYFYTHTKKGDDLIWYEYRARFCEGKLMHLISKEQSVEDWDRY